MSDIQVFVVMGMSGRGTATLNVKTTTLVKDFLQKIVDKEGVEGVRCTFRGKQLEKNRNGKDLTLRDYGLYNEANVFAALRLKGGAQMVDEGNNAKRFDKKQVELYGGIVGIKNCIIGANEGCYESNIKKAELSCGCVYCADCMRWNINKQLVNVVSEINCGDSSHGDTILDLSLAYAIAAFSNNEKLEKDALIARNALISPNSILSTCPNGKCQQFMMRDNIVRRVQCGTCKLYICWLCKKKHTGNENGNCGNDNCDPVAYYTLLLEQATMITLDNKQVTDTRICPSKKCNAINIHDKACKHMTCKCTHQYCHICLKDWNGHDNSKCVVADKQIFTKDMLWSK